MEDADQTIDYIAQAESKDFNSQTSMENLNLFGVPLTDAETYELGQDGESAKERNAKKQFIRELIDAMDQVDEEDNVTQDFEKPKTFIKFDPTSDI